MSLLSALWPTGNAFTNIYPRVPVHSAEKYDSVASFHPDIVGTYSRFHCTPAKVVSAGTLEYNWYAQDNDWASVCIERELFLFDAFDTKGMITSLTNTRVS